MSIQNVMTVCIGNICRSPVAEGLLAQALPQCKVWSSGLHAVVGAPAEPTAQALALEQLDLAQHLAVVAHLVLVGGEVAMPEQRHLLLPLPRYLCGTYTMLSYNCYCWIAAHLYKNRSMFFNIDNATASCYCPNMSTGLYRIDSYCMPFLNEVGYIQVISSLS